MYSVITRDAAGGEVIEWVNADTVWASKQPVSGKKMYAGEGKHFEVSLLYRIRHRLDVAAGWRLQHGDDIFEIIDPSEVGRRQFLDLAISGIDQDAGSALDVLLLEGTGADVYLQLEDETPLLLEAAA